MLPLDSQIKDSADILKALGQLALAASQAEAYAAQGLYYLLTDTPGNEEGAARIAAEFRSFNSLHRLLTIALRCDTRSAEFWRRQEMTQRSATPTAIANLLQY